MPKSSRSFKRKVVCHTVLHELEFMNALQLKVFTKNATTAQVAAAHALVETDLKAGVLISPSGEWKDILAEAARLAERYTGSVGCRSLDILHCAAAKLLVAAEFVSTDGRQKKLAQAMGLNLVTF